MNRLSHLRLCNISCFISVIAISYFDPRSLHSLVTKYDFVRQAIKTDITSPLEMTPKNSFEFSHFVLCVCFFRCIHTVGLVLTHTRFSSGVFQVKTFLFPFILKKKGARSFLLQRNYQAQITRGKIARSIVKNNVACTEHYQKYYIICLLLQILTTLKSISSSSE